MVFDIGMYLWMRFHNPAELCLPVALVHYPIDMAFSSVCTPTTRVGGIEIDLSRGAHRIIGIEDRTYRPVSDQRLCDTRLYPFTGHICQLLVHQLGRISVTFTHQIPV